MAVFQAALVQMTSSRDPDRNAHEAEHWIREAADAGAAYVQTPEMTNIMPASRAELMAKIRAQKADPTLKRFKALAKDLGIWLHVGSLAMLIRADGRAANRGFLIAPDGKIAARYDKIHMFDVDLPTGECHRESERMRPGRRAVVAATPWGGLGLAICYDLRFPQLARALAKAGASILTYPAAFTRPTGEAHWQVLIRARAIETGSFVLAAAQTGHHDNGRETYGHSIAVDPWGRVIAEFGTEPGVIAVEVDTGLVAKARTQIPALSHDRPFRLPARPKEIVIAQEAAE